MAFPFIDINVESNNTTDYSTFKEFEWDYTTGQYIVRNGNINVIEGKEALKIWIYKCLSTIRGKYLAYDWNYGVDTQSLINSGLTKAAIISESKRMVKEALLINKHILEVTNFNVTFGGSVGDILYKNSTLLIQFTAITNCGDITIKY